MSAKFPRGGGAGPFLARSLISRQIDIHANIIYILILSTTAFSNDWQMSEMVWTFTSYP